MKIIQKQSSGGFENRILEFLDREVLESNSTEFLYKTKFRRKNSCMYVNIFKKWEPKLYIKDTYLGATAFKQTFIFVEYFKMNWWLVINLICLLIRCNLDLLYHILFVPFLEHVLNRLN